MKDIDSNSVMQKMNFKSTGELEIQCIFPKYSKPIIDEIDEVLSQHYSLSAEDVDFIKNYDVKFRLGTDAGDEE